MHKMDHITKTTYPSKKDCYWSPITICPWLVLFIINLYMLPASAGQNVTGQIVIDGEIYNGSNSQLAKGSGKVGRESRQAHNFTRIINHSGADVHFNHGQPVSIEVTGDQNLLSHIKTRVHQGVLRISATQSYQTRLPLIVKLSAPELHALELHGAGDTKLVNLKGNVFELNLNGSGDVIAAGQIRRFLARLRGSGDINARNLMTEKTEIQISGSGDANIHARNSLKADIIGSGDILYYGKPASIKKNIIGSGDIESGD